MFKGGRCLHAVLLLVLIVLASLDLVATEVAADNTEEYFVARLLGPLNFKGRIVGSKGNL